MPEPHSAFRDGICPEKEIFFPVKSVPATSLQNSLFHSLLVLTWIYSALLPVLEWKVIFHQPFILLRLQFPTAKQVWGFFYLLPSYTPHSHSLGMYFWHWKEPFYTSRSFKKFVFSCRIDFIWHSCCKECQLPNCVINNNNKNHSWGKDFRYSDFTHSDSIK